MKKVFLFFFFALFVHFSAVSQAPKKLSSDEIYQSIKELNFLGSVLYLAAHPDDENTRLISYFSNELNARTAYLSLTRGDGGQNLIGPEIREQLGVIRTNELLQARVIDGGEQFFTRANDFGFSKTPDETFSIWDKEEVLKDVVQIIRTYQPDIIVNRFHAASAGRTHGHHTSSAILSLEAFDLASSNNYNIDQTNPWQVKRVFFNTSWRHYGSREKYEKMDKSEMIEINTGVYYPLFGKSNNEIASLSRSMHKSQGFGNTGTRGDQKEYIELIKGEMPQDKTNLFEGIDTTWNRVKGGDKISDILKDVERNFDFKNPSASIPELMRAFQLIQKLEDNHWKSIKEEQIKNVISACAGLYLEAVSNTASATRNEKVAIKIESINRSNQLIQLKKLRLYPEGVSVAVQKVLENNKKYQLTESITIPSNENYTAPYWLKEKGELGMYKVDDRKLIGTPETLRTQKVIFDMEIDGISISFDRNIVYKYNDPVKGEVYQNFEIAPLITSNIASQVVIFDTDNPKEIPVKIMAQRDHLKGTVQLKAPNNWRVTPHSIPFEIDEKGSDKTVIFVVEPPLNQSEGTMKVVAEIESEKFGNSLAEISYDHIPKQTLLLPAESKVVRLDVKVKSSKIAYIKGAGDEVPKYLKQIGYQVDEIDPKEILSSTLKKYDAVILGIRAYNTVDDLKLKQSILFEYVKNGGNMIVQYNTAHRLKVKGNLAPYKLELSKDRVTDENAQVRFVNPNHELLNYPNKISGSDFNGWVQERGLYFPNKWGSEFTPILSMNDPNEDPKEGSLLVAKYGEGYYIYTGLSFFRELPAGVPGAYKLFANMISVGKNETEKDFKN